jgi:hypothetical protein
MMKESIEQSIATNQRYIQEQETTTMMEPHTYNRTTRNLITEQQQ